MDLYLAQVADVLVSNLKKPGYDVFIDQVTTFATTIKCYRRKTHITGSPISIWVYSIRFQRRVKIVSPYFPRSYFYDLTDPQFCEQIIRKTNNAIKLHELRKVTDPQKLACVLKDELQRPNYIIEIASNIVVALFCRRDISERAIFRIVLGYEKIIFETPPFHEHHGTCYDYADPRTIKELLLNCEKAYASDESRRTRGW